jgi:serine phosphatase RsbU (regulator of sigma subunit)
MGLPGLPGPTVVTELLLPGDMLLAYTDGVTEARDATGVFYPLVDRLVARLKDGMAATPRAVVNGVWEDLAAYAGAVGDDVAMLALAPR